MSTQNVTESRLLVIDMQNVFNGIYDKWYIPNFFSIVQGIEKLVKRFDKENVTFTRFLPSTTVNSNSLGWHLYYEYYSGSLAIPYDSYDLIEPFKNKTAITYHTFGKCNDLNFTESSIYIVGVATGCCILSTVLSLIDKGKVVYVVKDLCLDVDNDAHENAIKVMSGFYPMVQIV